MSSSWIWDTWTSLWQSLWSALGLQGKKGTLLLLGLDNAGKTTLLHRLRTGDVQSFPPTDRPSRSNDSFVVQGITFQAWDLGGHEAVRHLWEDYICECQAVLFLIDASDSERLEEAGYELDSLLIGDGKKKEQGIFDGIPVAILCNKCDLETALSTEEIKERIDYASLEQAMMQEDSDNENRMAMFRISVLQGEGSLSIILRGTMTITFRKAVQGSITFKKAGEAAAAKAFETTTKVLPKTKVHAPAAPITPYIELTEPRAVSVEEAPTIIPMKESTKETMMPWKGWVDRLLQEKLSDTQYKSMVDFFQFWPEDPAKLHQMPPMAWKVPVAEGITANMRDVAPGSQPPVDIPLHDLDDDPYDSGYFKRDTRRRYIDYENPHPEIEGLKLDMLNPNDPEVQAAKEKFDAGPQSSPGNGNRFATGPSDFDPTGLRAVMAVTHKEMQKELDKHMPNHLPEPTWDAESEALYQWHKERDLPVPIGGNYNFIPRERRVARW
eukprot:Nitzschia sp. Nitz4//scaffold154_size52827//37511//39408//NITZ4_006782-RA/size52827-processed-gene-0.59-mRNA-1//-1//CDS//3329537326//960//frame0